VIKSFITDLFVKFSHFVLKICFEMTAFVYVVLVHFALVAKAYMFNTVMYLCMIGCDCKHEVFQLFEIKLLSIFNAKLALGEYVRVFCF
jgi:hypothetical protein